MVDKNMPRIVAITIGFANTPLTDALGLTNFTPNVKCIKFEIANKATAGASPTVPKANTAKGKPMLPQLLNIMGGTKVFGSIPDNLAIGQAKMPEPKTIATPHSNKFHCSNNSKSLLTKAETTNIGAITSNVALLIPDISG